MLPVYSVSRQLFARVIQIGAFGYGIREGFRQNAAVEGPVTTGQSRYIWPLQAVESTQSTQETRSLDACETVEDTCVTSIETSDGPVTRRENAYDTEQTTVGNVDSIPDITLLRRSVRAIMKTPAILEEVMPGGAPTVAVGRESAFVDAVVQVCHNPDIIAAARSHVHTQTQTHSLHSNKVEYKQEWSDLVGDSKCPICRDLLAAPCVSSCSHALCGECAAELMARCVCVDGNGQVSATCPYCHEAMTTAPTFVRMWDDEIAERAQTFPNCPEKEDWAARRLAYLNRMALERTKVICAENEDCDEEWAIAITVVAIIAVVAYFAAHRVR